MLIYKFNPWPLKKQEANKFSNFKKKKKKRNQQPFHLNLFIIELALIISQNSGDNMARRTLIQNIFKCTQLSHPLHTASIIKSYIHNEKILNQDTHAILIVVKKSTILADENLLGHWKTEIDCSKQYILIYAYF